MDLSLVLIMLSCSCLTLTCCIFSLVDHTKKGQVLFQLRK